MATTGEEIVPPISYAEGLALLDEQARRYLDMSAEEFLCKWDAGAFGDPDQTPGLMRVVMFLPMVRPSVRPQHG